MQHWDLRLPEWSPHRPEILFSSDDGRAISIDLPAGESLQDHQVHEAAWIVVIDGAVVVQDADGGDIEAEPGIVVALAPRERHEVRARTDARLLLLLTPWPGAGHPGAMSVQDKSDVRSRAAERS